MSVHGQGQHCAPSGDRTHDLSFWSLILCQQAIVLPTQCIECSLTLFCYSLKYEVFADETILSGKVIQEMKYPP